MPTWKKILVSGSNITELSNNAGYLVSSATASLLTTASVSSNTLTFTKGDGNTFSLTVDTGSGGGTPGGSNTSIQFNDGGTFSGSGNFTFNKTTNTTKLSGSLNFTGSLLATQSFISKVDYIDWALLPSSSAPPHNEGRLHWSDDAKTIEIDTDVADFMIELGHMNVVRVVNKTGGPLNKGKVVYISGSQGNRPTVVTASWDGDPTSAATLGFIARDIADNNNGYVITNGLLRDINTNAYTAGTQLYLSSSGDWTSTVPVSPKHEVRLGKVITQNATTGIIYVDIMNGYELGELHDVLQTSAQNGDLLIRSSSLWINSKNLTGSYTLSGSLITSGSQVITGSLTVFTGSGIEFQVTNTGVTIGNIVTDTHNVTGSLRVSGSITGSLFGTASWAVNALTASFVSVSSTNTNATYYPHFGNSSSGVDNVEVDTNLTYNPFTNTLTTTTFAGTATGINVTDADTLLVSQPLYLLFSNVVSGQASAYTDNELTYNSSTNTLLLANASTQSFGDDSRFVMGSTSTMVLGKGNVFRVGDTTSGGGGQVFISGSTNLYRSGSTILSVSGSFGSIMEVTDALKTNIFQVDNGSNTLLAVTTAAPGGVSLSGSIKLFGLTNPTKTNVLTYDTSTGEVFYTASSAVGGGGSATPGGANTTIQFNDSSVFSGSANYTFTKASNLVQLTGSFVVSGSTPMRVIGTSVVTGSLGVTGSILLNGSPISQPKAGSGSAASFSGTPLTSSISFGTAFSNNNYAVTVTGEDARSWTLQSKTSASFTINSNSSVALTGPVYWIATPFNS